MTALDRVPESLVSADSAAGAVHLTVDANIYPLDAVFAAAFTFMKRHWLFVDRPDADHYKVTLAAKDGDDDLGSIAGDFANELLSCAYRQRLAKESRATVEAVTFQAMAGAMGPPSLEELEDFDFSDDAFEDPLGIAQSWEEKYAKKDKTADDDGGDAATSDGDKTDDTDDGDAS